MLPFGSTVRSALSSVQLVKAVQRYQTLHVEKSGSWLAASAGSWLPVGSGGAAACLLQRVVGADDAQHTGIGHLTPW